ncbi:MAG: DNA polymerase III subunit gamma/tau [Leptospiraceae bacterium]|nr:DNA polymerase III subunit gamma/tau [Leptospiraceae bacterium]MCP5498981.1 DNA polymerase III subunit gamma/tau [Leptospiraceae bacterium]
MSDNHQVFARKYRPQKFKEVIYQKLAINALQNALKTNRVGHAYIFFGPRGVGKTTIARILAKRLNCEKPTEDNEPCCECLSCKEITRGISNDVLEIDAASNRGIDNIRDLRESVKFNPMGGKNKIYIIDEVHMLTDASFNALLKTLEEPPPHVVFILATTEYHKIPETILSRCQDFVFKKVPIAELQAYVEELCKRESIHYDQEGLFWIAKKGDGSVRDTLSFLEQAVTFTDSNLNAKLIEKMLGYQGVEIHIEFLSHLLSETSHHQVIKSLEKLFQDGSDMQKFVWDFVEFTHSTVLIKENLADRENINFPAEDIQKIRKEVEPYDIEVLTRLSEYSFKIYEKLIQLKLRNSYEIKIFLELQFRKIINELNKPSLSGVLEKIRALSELIQKQPSGKSIPSASESQQSGEVEPSKSEATFEIKEELAKKENSKSLEKPDVESLIMEQFSGTEIEPGKIPEI